MFDTGFLADQLSFLLHGSLHLGAITLRNLRVCYFGRAIDDLNGRQCIWNVTKSSSVFPTTLERTLKVRKFDIGLHLKFLRQQSERSLKE